MFFGHLPELALILVGALIIFGPKRLPEVGSALGQGIRDFKRGVAEITEASQASIPPAGEPIRSGMSDSSQTPTSDDRRLSSDD